LGQVQFFSQLCVLRSQLRVLYRSATFSASEAINRDSTIAIGVSLSALDNKEESGRVVHTVTHAPGPEARRISS
jgi:hypothetical protein